jgi:hypothetical protein
MKEIKIVEWLIPINEPRRYVINWWVASQSTQATNGVVFALASSQGDLLEGNSPIKTGEVVGFGVIEITSAPQTLSLINASNAEVFYAVAVPLTATLVIVEDDNTGEG